MRGADVLFRASNAIHNPPAANPLRSCRDASEQRDLKIAVDLQSRRTRSVTPRNSLVNKIIASEIIAAVSAYFHVPLALLVAGNNRSKTVTLPRFVAMMLIRNFCDETYEAIGKRLHAGPSSVCQGIQVALRRIRDDDVFDQQIIELLEIIRKSACK